MFPNLTTKRSPDGVHLGGILLALIKTLRRSVNLVNGDEAHEGNGRVFIVLVGGGVSQYEIFIYINVVAFITTYKCEILQLNEEEV